MEFRDVTSEERAELYDWREEASKLNRRRQIFFQELIDAFAAGSEASHFGIEFSLAAGTENCLLIKTPVSSGRIRFNISPVGLGLIGKILVERAEVDCSDSQVWLPVWGFCLGDARGIIYFNTPRDANAYEMDGPERGARTEAFERIGKSIAYALSAGPILVG